MKLTYSLLCLLLLTGTNALSQDSTDVIDPIDIIMARPHISATMYGGITAKADVSTEPYKYQIGSSPQIAFGGGFNYHMHINKQWSIIIGLHAGAVVRNFEYYIRKDEFVPAMEYDVIDKWGTSREVYFLFRLPLSIEKRWWQQRKYWSASVGASLQYATLNEETIRHTIQSPSGQMIQYHTMRLQTNNNSKPWFNYQIGTGPGWILKNKNLLSFQLFANLSCTKFVNGNYDMSAPGQPVVRGNTSFKGSFVAIAANYILTRAKKRFRLLK